MDLGTNATRIDQALTPSSNRSTDGGCFHQLGGAAVHLAG
jgi:hypothetical protein